MSKFSKQEIRSLEAYLKSHVTNDESEDSDDWDWSYRNYQWEFPTILSRMNHEYKTLLRLHSLMLKRSHTKEFLEKRLKVEKLTYEEMWTCLKIVKVLIKSPSQLPLLVNDKKSVTRFAAMWRLENGI